MFTNTSYRFSAEHSGRKLSIAMFSHLIWLCYQACFQSWYESNVLDLVESTPEDKRLANKKASQSWKTWETCAVYVNRSEFSSNSSDFTRTIHLLTRTCYSVESSVVYFPTEIQLWPQHISWRTAEDSNPAEQGIYQDQLGVELGRLEKGTWLTSIEQEDGTVQEWNNWTWQHINKKTWVLTYFWSPRLWRSWGLKFIWTHKGVRCKAIAWKK